MNRSYQVAIFFNTFQRYNIDMLFFPDVKMAC